MGPQIRYGNALGALVWLPFGSPIDPRIIRPNIEKRPVAPRTTRLSCAEPMPALRIYARSSTGKGYSPARKRSRFADTFLPSTSLHWMRPVICINTHKVLIASTVMVSPV